MANEYLTRTPTSTGNRRVWTWSYWIKKNALGGQVTLYTTQASSPYLSVLEFLDDNRLQVTRSENGTVTELLTTNTFRDIGNWMHIIVAFNTTSQTQNDRVKLYVNGVLQSNFTGTYPSINYEGGVNRMVEHDIGTVVTPGYPNGYPGAFLECEFADIFFIDGQALTPDVFGFNKQGKGYISVGSTQSTDFRPGQWVPKTPRVIKTAINNNGGFGVNGFYLPMNDSNNFGADFHCDPNSIIKLQENLPQPKCRIDGVGDYTGALRNDPFKQYLVLALPFVSGGLQSGFGDYAPSIKGSGSAKTITNNTSVSIANTHGYYGNAAYIDSVNYLTSSSSDYAMGTGDFTVEGWINQTGGDTTYSGMFSTALSNSTGIGIAVARDQVWLGNNGTAYGTISASSTFWPLNQWTHIAVTRSGTTMRVFTNGVCSGITTTATGNIERQNAAIGRRYFDNSSFTPIAYIQDLRIYKGVAKYTGGFDVPRPYTPVGIATWRAVPDTTANNFATWNPLDRARNTGTQTDGNLSTGTNSGNYAIRSTVGVSTGKWYWEFCPTAVSITNHHGIVAVGRSMGAFYLGETLDSWGMYDNNGNKRNNGSYDSYGTGFSQYDVGMVALDKSNGKIWWGKNGTWFASGNPSNATNEAFSNINIVCSGIGTDSFVSPSQLQYNSCSYNFGQNPSFSGNTTAGTYADTNGKGLFKYQPPSGFLALCEDNLPTPAIANPGRHFKTVLWTGDGNSGRSIVGVGFTPDLVWIKSRNVSLYHLLTNSVTGVDNTLSTNSTDAESFSTERVLNSFDSDGFSLNADDGSGYYGWNVSGQNMVAWCWKAGAGTTSTNTNGSITSVVSANQDAGFSIVSFTMPSGTYTVGHGLGKTPKFIITKQRDGSGGWWTQHASIGAGTAYLDLSSTAASTSLSWGGIPNSSTFTINNSYAVAGQRVIAYCWAEIEGYSKFGSYVGNGSADGPFVYCGFKPAWVMIKRTDSTDSWAIFDSSRDSTNPVERLLRAESTNIEATMTSLVSNPFGDLLSNGFKIRNTSTIDNVGSYIFAAYAESPFQTANSK